METHSSDRQAAIHVLTTRGIHAILSRPEYERALEAASLMHMYNPNIDLIDVFRQPSYVEDLRFVIAQMTSEQIMNPRSALFYQLVSQQLIERNRQRETGTLAEVVASPVMKVPEEQDPIWRENRDSWRGPYSRTAKPGQEFYLEDLTRLTVLIQAEPSLFKEGCDDGYKGMVFNAAKIEEWKSANRQVGGNPYTHVYDELAAKPSSSVEVDTELTPSGLVAVMQRTIFRVAGTATFRANDTIAPFKVYSADAKDALLQNLAEHPENYVAKDPVSAYAFR